MWNNKSNKGVSLVEAMVAIFILGVIAAVVLNSSSIFTRSQQTLISSNRKDQMADLILQDIMEYTKFQNNLYGTITANSLEDDEIVVSGVTSTPQPGDMFLVDGVPGRYILKSITGAGPSWTITSETNFPQVSISSGTLISFIAFKKQDLDCFDGLNLSGAAPIRCPDDSLMPSKVTALFNHWKSEIDNEFGPEITTRQIQVTNDGLVKVTLGDGTNNTVLARKINNCIFQDTPSSVAFTFPGKANAVVTGIIEGEENPVAHYFASGVAQHFPNLENDVEPLIDTPNSCRGPLGVENPAIFRTGASTCRQTYAGSNTISVFLYKYTGPRIRVRPTNCTINLWPQCGGVVIENGDLSLWFIFDEYNSWNNRQDLRNVGEVLPGDNQGGYLLYETRSLPDTAKILIFDDSSESCQGNISGGTCRGQYKWNNAHDGLVIHLDTPELKTLSDIQLEIRDVTFGIKSWRVLRDDVPDCLIASDMDDSEHGTAWNVENPDTCWDEVNAEETNLEDQLESDTIDSMTVVNSSIFPMEGQVQVGNEVISYRSNNTATNTLSTLGRGIKKEAELTEAIGSSGVPGDGIEDWSDQVLTVVNDAGELGDPEIGFRGGYLIIDNEIFKADYGNSFDRADRKEINFTARAQLGTSAQAHAIGARVYNHDMRAQTWREGTPVYEGPLNSIAVVQAESADFRWDTVTGRNAATFPRVRMKKRVTLNLTSAEVCQ